MDNPVLAHEQVLAHLRDAFYESVPATFQTYCVLTAHICQRVLENFGIAARVVPCQLWWAGPERNFVLGFCGGERSEYWDGHTVCMAGDWLIDAGLRHVRDSIGVNVPAILLSKAFGISSNVISRFHLSGDEWLWWHHPPRDREIAIPREPEELIARYANALIMRLRAELGSGNADAMLAETCAGSGQGMAV